MAYYSDSAKALILAQKPDAAKWIHTTGRTASPACAAAPTQTGSATGGRPNKYAGSCKRCHGHVAEGAGLLDKVDGKFVIFHNGHCPEKTEQPSAPAKAARPATPNRYAGSCKHCGQLVGAGEGVLTGGPGTWKVAHHDGTCPDRTPATASDRQQDTEGERIAITDEQYLALQTGYFTVELTSGPDAGQHRTFRIRRKRAGQRNEGQLEVSWLGGRNNMSDYWLLGVLEPDALVTTKKIHSAVMRQAVQILLGDPHAAQLGYARASERCYRCGIPLTTPESLKLLIGPDCIKKDSH